MIKENQTFLNFLQVLFDLVTISLALLLAYWIRFVSPFFTDGIRRMNFVNYFHLLIFILPTFLVCFYFVGLYKPYRKVKFHIELERIFFGNTIGILILIFYLYYTKDVNYSRLMLGYFYIISIVFLSIERFLVRFVLRQLRERGYNLKHILVIGAGENGQNFIKKIKNEPELGYSILGFIDDYLPADLDLDIDYLGPTKNLNNIINSNYIDEVVIALNNANHKKINNLIDICEFAGVKTQVIPDYVNLIQGKQAYIDELNGIPLINTRYIPLDNPFNNQLKRLIDIIGSIAAIIIFSPVMLVTAICVKLTSPGPIIYKQIRLGKNRKEFYMYKFRSMVNDQPDQGNKGWSVKNDPRITKVGKIIRKFSIDELPQFFNVLKGDMSLVGPRPELPYWVGKYKDQIDHYMIKHHVRPGVSGLSQVRGLRGDTDIQKRINTDIDYIENWNLWLDFLILLKTPYAMLHGS